nr:PREDICTED: zinc finger protein 124-like [Bemisia tabaci]
MTNYWKNKNLYTSYFQFNICRLCATECDSLTPIFGNCNVNETLDLKIKKYLPVIMVQEDDIKPKQICASCISKLNLYSGLIDSCIAADQKFEVLIQKAYSSTSCYPMQIQDVNFPSQPAWDVETSTKSEEKTDVLLIENLDNMNKAPEQEYVVMVELKYKDNLPQGGRNFNEGNVIPDNNVETIVTYVTSDKGLGADNGNTSLTIDNCSLAINSESELETDPSKLDLVIKNDFEPTYCNLVSRSFNDTPSNLISNMYQSKEKGASLVDLPEAQVLNASVTDEQSVETPALDGKRYKCTTCDKSFARKSRCKAHIISHSKSRPFNCENCGKNFFTKWECKLHERIHIGTLKCEFCGKAFSVRNKLERHRRIHTGEKPFACKYCVKSFADKRNLDNHLRTHTGERPYKCQTCDDRFRTLTHLKDHQTVHTKETPFSCYLCNKRFKWKTNLQIHLKKHPSKDANSALLNISPCSQMASGMSNLDTTV